eukprot:CAMPEP_0168392608 /NCGR_PEP_ID=MMETSP0228-20121227/18584_1 /TAXON_ID=133427 /ORGANISM="Protoceratium reticulatum, Strain CCCM 535 (=CCMP 1889)" /LENGTH=43 /DNA_ID= /DNA_START= /DNA_END= /DNA_ORIENTATION=
MTFFATSVELPSGTEKLGTLGRDRVKPSSFSAALGFSTLGLTD